MVGGRKEEGGFSINNSNVFAALDTLRKKKNKDNNNKKGGKSSKIAEKTKENETQVLWQPTPLKVTSWADVDEDDDDDYYATSAPLLSAWGPGHVNDNAPLVEESESDDDMLDLGDEEVEDEHEHETEAPVHSESVVMKAPESLAPPKETERQLSKKERKKKELEELEALLADFGVHTGNNEGPVQEKKTDEKNNAGESDTGEKKDAVPAEPKNAKKKKKKDKTTKEAKETQDQTDNGEKKDAEPTEQVEEDASSLDVKERLKKLAASKKKKSSKEMDGAAKAAALEAAARNARLAASKKKEKSHYNQQPVR